ncbi:unnamed protein product [Linum trigynum]|uniref:Uncharacterized protein n=1 Tax=Linum trigynum TaxID=586398 RepID=A0AAV2DMM0_9ROSI
MAKSLLLYLHYYSPIATSARSTRIICSTGGGGKKNPPDHPRRSHRANHDPAKLKNKQKYMDLAAAGEGGGGRRHPLSEVVSDCVRRWFEDTLRDANAGDIGMQVLVGQMYCAGYGVPKDVVKGRAWINRASKTRSSAKKVGDKHPGYNASDSDS